jgi:hypothetical protein
MLSVKKKEKKTVMQNKCFCIHDRTGLHAKVEAHIEIKNRILLHAY